ncbi:MAG: glycoside hydrolase [Cyanobacteria bacterium]|nr:glycoside hydrolase [Cyanobacteriota bacterium]
MERTIRDVVVAALIVVLPAGSSAQSNSAGQIAVGENVLVSTAADDRPLVEPQLVVNPKDSKHLLATAMTVDSSTITNSNCAAFVSFDGGRTWARHNFGLPECADPWLVLRHDGTALFAGLSMARGNEMQLARSANGGRTWASVPLDIGRGHDHATMIVDTTTGPHAGSIYLVSNGSRRDGSGRPSGSIFVTRSADGGKTFTPPVHVVPSNLNFNVLTPGVLSNGTLVVPYTDFQSNISDFKSRAGELERKRTWVVTSPDGGQTFSYPLFVSEACGLGFGSLAVDMSTRPRGDRLYFVCNNRELNGILVHASDSGGEKWSQPVRADSAAGEVVFRRPPALAVNGDGVLGVTWVERRKEGVRQCQNLFFTASLDGGKTFLPEVRVSSAGSCPATARNGRVATRWPEGGDYSGLAAAPDGTFHVVWADSRDGIYRLWTAPVTIKATTGGKR